MLHKASSVIICNFCPGYGRQIVFESFFFFLIFSSVRLYCGLLPIPVQCVPRCIIPFPYTRPSQLISLLRLIVFIFNNIEHTRVYQLHFFKQINCDLIVNFTNDRFIVIRDAYSNAKSRVSHLHRLPPHIDSARKS